MEQKEINKSISSASFECIGKAPDGQLVVAKPSDGALSEIYREKDSRQQERVIPFNSARTTFYTRDIRVLGEDDDEDLFKRLWKYHHEWDSDDSGRRTHRDKQNIAQALADTLGLNKYQKERTKEIVSMTNGRSFNRIGGVEALALGAIAYVGDEEAQRLGTLDARVYGSDEFESLCKTHSVDGWKALKKIKKKMQQQKKS